MTKPYTDAEVNAAIAATVAELQARIQQLETYARCDAETIEQLQGRVKELESQGFEFGRLCNWAEREATLATQQAAQVNDRLSRERHLGYVNAMSKISEKMRRLQGP